MVLNVWREIKKNIFAPIYVLYGTEPYLINETKQLLIKHALNGETDMNLSTYDLEEIPIEVPLEDAETIPFLGEKRIIIMNNPVFLTSEKTKEKVTHNLRNLEAYIKNPSPYSIVVFSCPYEKLDERKKITKELKRKAVVVEAKRLNEKELRVWVREKAIMSGATIADDAVNLLLELIGDNLFMLTTEVEKLALYANGEKKIDASMVEKLVSRSLEQNIFALVDKIIQRKIDEALRIYYDLLKQNEEPIKILSILSNQFRLVYQVKELSRRGYGQQQIAKYLKVHPYRIKVAAGQGKEFKDEELATIMKMLAEADYKCKTGGMHKELVMEMVLFQIQDLKAGTTEFGNSK